MLSVELCGDVIQRFDRDARKVEGKTVSPDGELLDNPEVKQNMELGISGLIDWLDVDQQLLESLKIATSLYFQEFPAFRSIGAYKDTGYKIQRYTTAGDFYDWHIDLANPITANRMLGAIWYLNTVEAGGETEFKSQEKLVKPMQGHLLLFPPFWTHEHRAIAPESEDKYIVTTFMTF